MRRLIRYSMKTILVAMTLVAIFCALWTQWPSITARNFLSSRGIDSISILVETDTRNAQVERMQAFIDSYGQKQAGLEPHERSFADLLVGRQKFTCGDYEITACRGRVAIYGPYGPVFYFGGLPLTR